MALLHHETFIMPAIASVSSWGFWWILILAYAAAMLHQLKHAWIRIRYGSTIETNYRAAEACESCQREAVGLFGDHVGGLYQESWLCSMCGTGKERITSC